MKIHIEISDEQHRKLKTLKKSEGRPMQFLIAWAINIFLKLKKVK